MKAKTNKQRGFTLLEILVASAIFVMLYFMAFSAVDNVRISRAQKNTSQKQLGDIQLSFMYFERDFQQISRRPIRGGSGDYHGEIIGDELSDIPLQITRGGLQVLEDLPKSSLQRVGYVLKDEVLYRITWPVLDQAQDTEPREKKLLANVEKIEFRFLSDKGEWQPNWNSGASDTNTGQAGQTVRAVGIPKAAAVRLTIKGIGEVNRLFLLSEV